MEGTTIMTAFTQAFKGSFASISVKPEPGERFYSSDFNMWIPDGVEGPLRGILLKQHGCGDNGMNHAYDLQFQSFASKWSMALMSSHLTYDKDSSGAVCSDWYNPENGTGRAFFVALQGFAEASGRLEIANLPIAFYGHSGGGGWSAFMNKLYPERTIAYIHMKGKSIGDVGAITASAACNPGLLIIGEQDLPERNAAIENYFAVNRRNGALLAKAVARNTEHEVGNIRFLALPFLNDIFSRRLPVVPSLNGVTQLNTLHANEGWLADHVTLTIGPASTYSDSPVSASWLPSQASAEHWRQFSADHQAADTTGGVVGIEPPAAPTELRLLDQTPNSLTIAWEAAISWHGGIRCFHIYRDGACVGTVNGQSLLYGDYPDDASRMIPLEWTDSSLSGNTAYRYEVTQVDRANQESERSFPLII